MYYSELAIADGLLFDTEPSPKCEYRHAQWDGGSQTGQLIQCRNTATQWTDRGLRCDDHRRD